MDILKIYEKVNLKVPLEQRRFINYYNDTVDELMTMHPDFVLIDNITYKPATNVHDDCLVRDLYIPPIVDNIIFLAGADKDGTYKTEFLRKAQLAYNKYWHDGSKNHHVKRMGWI